MTAGIAQDTAYAKEKSLRLKYKYPEGDPGIFAVCVFNKRRKVGINNNTKLD